MNCERYTGLLAGFELLPRATLMKCLSYPFRNLRGRLCELANQLPVRRGEKEDKDDVDKEEKEIFFHEGVFNPTSSLIPLEVG